MQPQKQFFRCMILPNWSHFYRLVKRNENQLINPSYVFLWSIFRFSHFPNFTPLFSSYYEIWILTELRVSKTFIGNKWVKLASTGLLNQQSELYIAAQNRMVELKMHDHFGYMNTFLLIVENTACLEWQLVVILTYLVPEYRLVLN